MFFLVRAALDCWSQFLKKSMMALSFHHNVTNILVTFQQICCRAITIDHQQKPYRPMVKSRQLMITPRPIKQQLWYSRLMTGTNQMLSATVPQTNWSMALSQAHICSDVRGVTHANSQKNMP